MEWYAIMVVMHHSNSRINNTSDVINRKTTHSLLVQLELTEQMVKRRKSSQFTSPKALANMIWATTKDSTCVSFGMGHRCMKHNQIFTLQHLASCSEIQGCQNITRFAKRIKEQHILDWEEDERT